MLRIGSLGLRLNDVWSHGLCAWQDLLRRLSREHGRKSHIEFSNTLHTLRGREYWELCPASILRIGTGGEESQIRGQTLKTLCSCRDRLVSRARCVLGKRESMLEEELVDLQYQGDWVCL